MTVPLVVNGEPVEAADESASLLSVLREQLGLMSVKDGCSPQGQCGCCTVLIDGAPRVACVTPVRRVRGRDIVTLEGLGDESRAAWGEAFCATGASQCGFCTPGIILRLEAAVAKHQGDPDPATDAPGRDEIDRALAAHLCRCTGWNTIREAVAVRVAGRQAQADPATTPALASERDLQLASQRATIEGRTPQRVDAEVPLGRAGFADDTAPADALVAVSDGAGGWSVGETLAEARRAAGKVQGRRTTVDALPPLSIPEGTWDLALSTSWVEPAYLETDASWCRPGGEPSSSLANGGAFGAKHPSPVTAAARALADEHGRAVLVLLSREDAVRLGPKRPPLAVGLRSDGTGVAHVVRTDGIADAFRSVLPGVEVHEVDMPGPRTSAGIRGAGWVEAAVLRAVLDASANASSLFVVETSEGARARATVDADGTLEVHVACGDPLDEVVLRSYCIGAAHMALGWVTSEAIAVDEAGVVQDLTIRSFGIVRPADMPPVTVHIERPASPTPPVNGSDAVLAAVAAAVWSRQGTPPQWPTRLPWPQP